MTTGFTQQLTAVRHGTDAPRGVAPTAASDSGTGATYCQSYEVRRLLTRVALTLLTLLTRVEDAALARELARDIYKDAQRLPSTATREHLMDEG